MTSALAQPAVSPLGTIRLASFVENGSGSGKGKLRRYPSYALVCLVDGLGYYRDSAGVSQTLVPGDLIWVSPRVAHDYGPQERHFWNEFFIVFDGPVFDLWESRKLFEGPVGYGVTGRCRGVQVPDPVRASTRSIAICDQSLTIKTIQICLSSQFLRRLPSMANTFSCLNVHCVFSTKQRIAVL